MQQTGVVKIREQGNNRKDRYTSCSYASYFASILEKDLFSKKKLAMPVAPEKFEVVTVGEAIAAAPAQDTVQISKPKAEKKGFVKSVLPIFRQ